MSRPPIAAVLLIVLALSLAVSGQQVQKDVASFQTTGVQTLVSVTTGAPPQVLLPGHEYQTSATVSWAISPDAVKDLNEGKITVFVVLSGKGSDSAESWVYFKGISGNGPVSKQAFFTLECNVNREAGTCSAGSITAMQVPVFFKAPQDAKYPHSDGIVTQASLIPFGQFVATQQASDKIGQAQKALDGSGAGDAAASLKLKMAQDALNKAYADFSQDEAVRAYQLATDVTNQAARQSNDIFSHSATGFVPQGSSGWMAGGLLLLGLVALGYFAHRRRSSERHRRRGEGWVREFQEFRKD
ncbi:hypothetical protein HY995_01855 [Candidatus Micrarchaeota archaeon]|nr:hypothetical protein [Candidatus Micrarchaeota archaeon]MBI5176811.1 hypothetical protein [Candidatus Micrarchaeota archaeon]